MVSVFSNNFLKKFCRYDNSGEVLKNPFVANSVRFKGLVLKETRYFKVKSYVGVIVPIDASGRFNFNICYPSRKCKSGEVALFGVATKPKLKSLPIDSDHFTHAMSLISNEDSRKIKVGTGM